MVKLVRLDGGRQKFRGKRRATSLAEHSNDCSANHVVISMHLFASLTFFWKPVLQENLECAKVPVLEYHSAEVVTMLLMAESANAAPKKNLTVYGPKV